METPEAVGLELCRKMRELGIGPQDYEAEQLCVDTIRLDREAMGRRVDALERALIGAFHREGCKNRGFGVCSKCIEGIKKMEEAINPAPAEKEKT